MNWGLIRGEFKTKVYKLLSYLQESSELDHTPSEAFGFWLDQTHLVHIYSEEPLGLAAIFTDHHTGD